MLAEGRKQSHFFSSRISVPATSSVAFCAALPPRLHATRTAKSRSGLIHTTQNHIVLLPPCDSARRLPSFVAAAHGNCCHPHLLVALGGDAGRQGVESWCGEVEPPKESEKCGHGRVEATNRVGRDCQRESGCSGASMTAGDCHEVTGGLATEFEVRRAAGVASFTKCGGRPTPPRLRRTGRRAATS